MSLRIAFVSYNRSVGHSYLEDLANENKEITKSLRLGLSHSNWILNDGTHIDLKDINVSNYSGMKFDQIILCDDFRKETLHDEVFMDKFNRFAKEVLMCSCVPEDYQIIFCEAI